MHTYRKGAIVAGKQMFEVGYWIASRINAEARWILLSTFENPTHAARYVSFLNGGEYVDLTFRA